MDLVISGTGDFYEGAPVTRLLDTARSYQIEHVDLWFPKNTRVEGLNRSVELIHEAGIHVVCVSTWTHLYWPGNVATQQGLLIEGIELAHRLGASLANTYFGHGVTRDDDLAISTYVETLQPCLERAAALDVTICLDDRLCKGLESWGWNGLVPVNRLTRKTAPCWWCRGNRGTTCSRTSTARTTGTAWPCSGGTPASRVCGCTATTTRMPGCWAHWRGWCQSS